MGLRVYSQNLRNATAFCKMTCGWRSDELLRVLDYIQVKRLIAIGIPLGDFEVTALMKEK